MQEKLRSRVIALKRRVWARYDYQSIRVAATEKRWSLIHDQIDEGARSLLDVGCNVGLMTFLAARSGLVAIGVEGNWVNVRTALRRCKPQLSLAFMHLMVTPENVDGLPVCDVLLCLSIYHQWHAHLGHEAAQQILKTLGQKAQRILFFEAASTRRKYGAKAPQFIDHDVDSIVDYNRGMLGELFGPSRVEFISPTPASRGEKKRYLFAVRA